MKGRMRRLAHMIMLPEHELTRLFIQLYNRELKTLLDDDRDNAVPVSEIGEKSTKEHKSGGGGGDGGKKKRVALEDITRFTMVKRIW